VCVLAHASIQQGFLKRERNCVEAATWLQSDLSIGNSFPFNYCCAFNDFK
jgi:hypothetical protein